MTKKTTNTTTASASGRVPTSVRKLAVTAMLAALAAVIQLFEIPVPAFIPDFVKLDFSELPALIASFVVSPPAGISVCLIKNIVKLTTSNSAGVGELCNFLLGVAMVVPAGFIYKYKKSRVGALTACFTGCVISAVISVFVNYFISYPVYFQVLAPEEAVLEAYKALNPNVSNLWDALIWFNAPFTFVKMLIDSVITFLIYKPLSNALKKVW